MSLAQAGDTVSIANGDYTNGCTISSAFASDVTVTGTASARLVCAPLSFSGASHIIINGPTIEQLATNATSNHLTFENLLITCSDSAPFTLYAPDNLCDASATISGTPNITFTNVSVGPTYDASSCTGGQGNDTSKFLGSTTATLTNVTYHDARRPSVSACGSSQHTENLMIADVGSQNGGSITFNRCMFTNGAASGTINSGAPDGSGPNTAELFFDGQDTWSGDGKNGVNNMTLQDCVFTGAGSHGLHSDGFANLTNTLIENNTWIITSDFDYSGVFTSLNVHNNIGNDGLCINSNSGGGGSYTNNVFYDPGNTGAASNCGDVSNTGVGSSGVSAIFKNYPSDLTLSVASVALDKGTNPFPVTDYNGVIRPQGSAPDAGAFELVSGSSTPGDLNSDGHVTIVDLSIMLSHYGTSGTPSQGDCNNDGTINIVDLSILLSHYGT